MPSFLHPNGAQVTVSRKQSTLELQLIGYFLSQQSGKYFPLCWPDIFPKLRNLVICPLDEALFLRASRTLQKNWALRVSHAPFIRSSDKKAPLPAVLNGSRYLGVPLGLELDRQLGYFDHTDTGLLGRSPAFASVLSTTEVKIMSALMR